MKFYKIKLPHTPGVGHQYPPNYEELIGNHNQGHVYYDDEIDRLFTLLIAIPDSKALQTLPENVAELTEAEAVVIADKYNPSTETITNEATIRRLEIKARLGIALTADENKALDPNDPTPGFGMSENFTSKLAKAKATEK